MVQLDDFGVFMVIQEKPVDSSAQDTANNADAPTHVSLVQMDAVPVGEIKTQAVATDALAAVADLEVAEMPSGVAVANVPTEMTNAVDVIVDMSADVQSVAEELPFPKNLPAMLGLCLSQHGRAYATLRGKGKNAYAVQVGSRALDNIIRKIAAREDIALRKSDIRELNDSLLAMAESKGQIKNVFLRVAAVDGGIEIDLGDNNHARVRITAGKVALVPNGSTTLFWRSNTFLPMAQFELVGDLQLLKSYLNLDDVSFMLLCAWLSYTLAHPKVGSSMFVILLLLGGQGSGKTFASKLIRRLIDPSPIGVQALPTNSKDLAISTQNGHVSCFDNARFIAPAMSDMFCTAATGGTLTTRQLYTDADQQVILLHGALIINGIHAFINQPDFAQRCLPMQLPTLPEKNRRSETELEAALTRDLPAIQRGLFDLIADVLVHLPTVKATHPQRMIDFVLWLAAMEKVDGAPEGSYQEAYSTALNDGQRECLMDNVLASTILTWAEKMTGDKWSGSPSVFLEKLNSVTGPGIQNSKDWPGNAISLSKRILPLQAALLSQGIDLKLLRGKSRMISVKWLDGMRPEASSEPDDDSDVY